MHDAYGIERHVISKHNICVSSCFPRFVHVIVFKYRVSFILGYDDASLGDLFPTFRGEVVVTKRQVRLSTDTASYSRLMKTPATPLPQLKNYKT